jgi:hypothetical protein
MHRYSAFNRCNFILLNHLVCEDRREAGHKAAAHAKCVRMVLSFCSRAVVVIDVQINSLTLDLFKGSSAANLSIYISFSMANRLGFGSATPKPKLYQLAAFIPGAICDPEFHTLQR